MAAMTKSASRFALAACAVVAFATLAGCKKSGMARIEKLRSALADGDTARVRQKMREVPTCSAAEDAAPERACLDGVAAAFGAANGFRDDSPDQAAAAAVASLLVREQRGDWFKTDGPWLASLRAGKGAGGDALRLAVLARLTETLPKQGLGVLDDARARTLAKAVAASIPGACPVYRRVGEGTDLDSLPPHEQPDHAPCVHADLRRPGGPGATYGYGALRAGAGARALLAATVDALEAGIAVSNGETRDVLREKLPDLHDAVAKTTLPELAPRPNEQLGGAAGGGTHDGPIMPADAFDGGG
jgi:hypothetical protein